MAVDCKNLKKPELCNFAGGSEQALEEQACELAQHGVSVKPDAENRNYCSYSAGNELIAPVAFQPKGYTLFSLQASEHQAPASYVAISKGVLAETPVEFRASLLSTADASIRPEAVVLEYTIIVSASSGYAFSDDSYLQSLILQKVRDDYQLNEGEENSDVLIKIAYRANDEADQGQRKLTYYVALSRNVLSAEEQVRREGPPFLTTEYCPEWIQHAEKVIGEVNADGTPIIPGWALIKKVDGKYTAIPREAVKDANRGKLGSVDSYSYSLETQLTNSQFLKTTDPIRLLRSVTYQGLGGVVGLECPVFEVEILEIPKRADNCLAWSEKLPQSELEKKYKGKLTKFGDGYLIAQKGNSAFRYIGATEDKASLDAAKAEVAKRAKPKEGFEFTGIKSQQTLNDPVCAAYSLFPQYKEVEHDEEVNSMRDDDLEKAIRLVDNETKKKNIREVGKIGEVKVVLKTNPETQKKQLIQIITETIHEDQPVPAQEVIFVVDRSGSMDDDAQNVSENFNQVMGELQASSTDNGLGLFMYSSEKETDPAVDLIVPLQSELDDAEEEVRMRSGLNFVASNISGGLEYTFEAAWRALDEFERAGTPDSLKKIIVLTDEGTMEKELQVMPDGITAEKLHERAEKLGVQFAVVFITEASNSNFIKTSKGEYLDYLDAIDVNPASFSEEYERINFWLSILNDPNASNNVKAYVLQRLGEAPPSFHERIAQNLSYHQEMVVRSSGMARYLLEALSRLHCTEARDAILNLFVGHFNPDCSQLFVAALAGYNDQESRDKIYHVYASIEEGFNLKEEFALVLLAANDERGFEYFEKKINYMSDYINLPYFSSIVDALERNGSEKAIEILQKYAEKSVAARDALLRIGQKESDYEKMLNRTTEYGGKSWLPIIKKKYPEKFADALVEYLLDEVRTGILLDVQGIQQIIAEYSEYREGTIDRLIASYDSPVNDFAERQNRILAVLTLFESDRAMDFVEQKVRTVDHPFGVVQTAVEIHRFNKNLKLLKNDVAAAREMLAADGEIQDHFAAAIALMRYHHDASALAVLLDLRLSSGPIYPYIAEALCESFEELGTVEARALLVMIVEKFEKSMLPVDTKLKFLQAIGKIGTSAEIAAISELLHSSDDTIAQAAQDAIDAILAREELKQ